MSALYVVAIAHTLDTGTHFEAPVVYDMPGINAHEAAVRRYLAEHDQDYSGVALAVWRVGSFPTQFVVTTTGTLLDLQRRSLAEQRR